MEKGWKVYRNGEFVNYLWGTEEYVNEFCSERGFTYEYDPYYKKPLTEEDKALIREHNWIEARLTSFINDHSWANTKERFELAARQYEAMIAYYLVLQERVVNDGLSDRLTEDESGDLFG